jgi:predicted nucleic acid-binding protein
VIVLDTNVVSEMAKPVPDGRVELWMKKQLSSDLYLCEVVVMEQSYGAERFRLRTKSSRYIDIFDKLLVVWRDRILAFDCHAAISTGYLRAKRESMGRPISVQDAMIAAICLAHGATLATRNTKDFEGLDLKLINPFEGT